MDRQSRRVSYYNLKTSKSDWVRLPDTVKPSSVAVGDGLLYFFDDSSPQDFNIGFVLLNATSEVSYLRNKTNRIKALKLFHPDLQKGLKFLMGYCKIDLQVRLCLGTNKCVQQPCPQLCIPLTLGRRTCHCTTGYEPTEDSCKGLQ